MLLLLASLLSARALAAEPTLTVGPVVVLPTNTTLPTEGLSVATCAAAGVPSTEVPSAEARSGTLVFEVRLRRGRVSVVSVMRSDIGLTAYEECLQRVLADFTWPVRRANVRVPVTVAVAERPPAASAEGGAGTEGAGAEGAGAGAEGAGAEGAGAEGAGAQ